MKHSEQVQLRIRARIARKSLQTKEVPVIETIEFNTRIMAAKCYEMRGQKMTYDARKCKWIVELKEAK